MTSENASFLTPNLPVTIAPLKVHTENDGNGNNRFKIGLLYEVIVDNQEWSHGWGNRDALIWLRDRAQEIVEWLDLSLDPSVKEALIEARKEVVEWKGQPVKGAVKLGVPLIRVERMNIKTVGTYHADADGYAIAGTIAFNEARLNGMNDCMVMAYLLKFLLVAWRHQSGGKGEFDKECRAKMKGFGVMIDAKGNLAIDPSGEFARLLTDCGIEIPAGVVQPPAPGEGKATSKLWSCHCQRARVGTKQFHARCLRCGEDFRPGDNVRLNYTEDRLPGTELSTRQA